MNLYDVLAGQGTTHFERLFSQRFAGGAVQTLTGQPPISFLSDGTPLTSVTIKGNGQQNGTPSPQNIVPFDGTGERTGNLFDKSKKGGQVYVTESITRFGVEIPVAAGTYTISGGTKTLFSKEKIGDTYGTALDTSYARTYTLSQDGYILIYASSESSYEVDNLMLVSGSTAPTSYIPYGWQIPLTCASQTTPLYLGEVSTTRRVRKLVLTGEETCAPYDTTYNRFSIVVSDWIQLGVRKSPLTCSHYQAIYDGRAIADAPDNSVYSDCVGTGRMFFKTTDYTDATTWKAYLAQQYAAGTPVVVWYVLAEPETAVVNEPLQKIGTYADELTTTTPIPTAKGSNTLSVDTTVQPSEMTITFKG